MALYTNEQIEKANQTNLEEYLQRRGEILKRRGSEFVLIYKDATGEHDSISIRGNLWYDHKNLIGGYPIRFMEEFYGLDFRGAMKELLNGEQPDIRGKKNTEIAVANKVEVQKSEKPIFQLPEKADNMKHLFAYLLQTRFLSKDVVQFFVDQKTLYQEKQHNNIVFVGTDQEGVPKSASKKSTVEKSKGFRMTCTGSDCSYGFCWRGKSTQLYVFEAAIDLMSFATMRNDDWTADSYLALDGLSPKPLLRFLEEQKHIKEIVLCLDYDAAGIEACDKIMDILAERGYGANSMWLHPLYKDWNEQLKAEHGVTAILPQTHPKKDAYHTIARKLGIMNANTESPYMKWRRQEYQKKGLDFYLEQIKRDFKQAEKSVKRADVDTKPLLASILRMADLSVCVMCEIEKENGFPMLTTYQKLIVQIEKEYKPYLDKARMERRIQEMKDEIGHLRKIDPQDALSLFLWARNMADMAMRAEIYMKTDYEQDLERRTRFEQQQKKEQIESEREEPMTMQMGG